MLALLIGERITCFSMRLKLVGVKSLQILNLAHMRDVVKQVCFVLIANLVFHAVLCPVEQ